MSFFFSFLDWVINEDVLCLRNKQVSLYIFQYVVLDHLTSLCFCILVFHLQPMATPHARARACLAQASTTTKTKCWTRGFTHFADWTCCIAFTALHLMFETEYTVCIQVVTLTEVKFFSWDCAAWPRTHLKLLLVFRKACTVIMWQAAFNAFISTPDFPKKTTSSRKEFDCCFSGHFNNHIIFHGMNSKFDNSVVTDDYTKWYIVMCHVFISELGYIFHIPW